MATATIRLVLEPAYTSFNLYWHSISWSLIKSIMQAYYSMFLLKTRPSQYGYVFQLQNYTRGRCPSGSYNLIYDIMRLWPDSYQERNALNTSSTWTQ